MDCAQRTLGISDCYDESVFNTSTPIKADPDIAGVGVISAFIIAAGLALLFTYIYILINEVAWVRERVDTKRWSTIIEQFVFSLSDQQLVTGLAVLIAGFARWDEISIYHWEIITDLAFVSSNTHLATLVVLRQQFRSKKKRWTRWIRVVAMVGLAIMLFVANTYTGYYRWSDDPAWPMRCVAVAFKCDLSYNYKGEPRRLAIVWSLYLVINYVAAVFGLFERPCAWTRNSVDRNLSSLIEACKIHWKKDDSGRLQKISKCAWDCLRMLPLLVLSGTHTSIFLVIEVTGWYLYNIIGLLLWRDALKRYLDEPGKEDDVLGFGQTLPLVLLLLPLLAFVEIFVNYEPH